MLGDLAFWTRCTWDADDGGFITHLDRAGNRIGVTDKYLVMQARMIRTLAAADRHGLTGRGYLDLARRGVRFLTERMWDSQERGFCWAVGPAGRIVDARKLTYGHAFAIYGLAEFATAAGDADALAWAVRTFDLLRERASDGVLGFHESLDGSPAWLTAGSVTDKTVNTHLHLLEAFMALARATGRPEHRAACDALLTLLLAKAIDAGFHCTTDPFDREWRPRLPGARMLASYGHGAELAWLCLDAIAALGRPREPGWGAAFGLVDHALAYGFDWAHGGLASRGPPRGRAAGAFYLGTRRLERNWWEQAEFLVATVEAYRLTGEPRYLAAFERQFDWVWTHQIDHDYGGWFERTAADGCPLVLDKGHAWKCPYHEARALMRVSATLAAIGVPPLA